MATQFGRSSTTTKRRLKNWKKTLEQLAIGNFEVTEPPSEQTTVIIKDGKLEKVHVNRLKIFYD